MPGSVVKVKPSNILLAALLLVMLPARSMQAQEISQCGLQQRDLARARELAGKRKLHGALTIALMNAASGALLIARDDDDQAVSNVFTGIAAIGLFSAYVFRASEGPTLHLLAGSAERTCGHADAAMLQFRKAHEARALFGPWRREIQSRALVEIGRTFRYYGRPDSMLAYYDRSRRTAGAATERLAVIGQEGDSYLEYLSRADSALAQYHEMLELARKHNARAEQRTALVRLGRTFALIDQLDSARHYYTAALRFTHYRPQLAERIRILNLLSEATPDPATRDSIEQRALQDAYALGRAAAADQLVRIGGQRLTTARAGDAIDVLKQAAELVGDERHSDTRIDALVTLAHAYNLSGDSDSASVVAGAARALLTRRLTERSRWRIYIALADAERARGNAESYARAVAYYDSAFSLEPRDADAPAFEAEQQRALGRWVVTWLARSPDIGNERAASAALGAAERGRARALLALMNTREGQGSDAETLGQSVRAGVRRMNEPALVYALAGDTLVTWLLGADGTIAVAQRQLPRAELHRQIVALRAALGVESSLDRHALRGIVDPGITGRLQQRGATLEDASRKLADLLLPAQIQNEAPARLTIIPHGVLSVVPFALLPVGSPAATLNTRTAIRYGTSLLTLEALNQRRANSEAASVEALVIGNPIMPTSPIDPLRPVKLLPLRGAESEARVVAAQLNTTGVIGAAASESYVRSRLNQARIIHLATHGYAYADAARVRDSFIALAPDARHDGLFTVGELIDDQTLQLQSELVVLSACETGIGQISEAEGVVGFQRALLAKGARSVLVSLWSVSDEATSMLMSRFYEHWLRSDVKPSKAEALRRAQQDVSRIPRFQHPRYWAAFVLNGAN